MAFMHDEVLSLEIVTVSSKLFKIRLLTSLVRTALHFNSFILLAPSPTLGRISRWARQKRRGQGQWKGKLMLLAL